MTIKTSKITLIGIYIAIALVLNIFENFLPTRVLIPGAKLGLANIITMISLMTLSKKETLVVIVIRVTLGSIFGGGLSGFLYSFSGAVISFSFMILVIMIFKNRISLIGISVTGAFFHGVGQVLMAAIIIQNTRIFVYLPTLLLASIATGIFIGYVSIFFLNRLKYIENISIYSKYYDVYF
ncbi:Gx transporter family protein [Helicovermis profundi]|uniref:Gx transporter family protein n=1 Tax=Helicovermis profundi TaxID=3065157 RepID=A0AAU9E1S9_9FIRM|nr:Gx transporter family protein [Clostridia bacterium S502]